MPYYLIRWSESFVALPACCPGHARDAAEAGGWLPRAEPCDVYEYAPKVVDLRRSPPAAVPMRLRARTLTAFAEMDVILDGGSAA